MSVKKHTPIEYGQLNLGGAQFSIFVCDTTAELPNGVAPMQFRKGDLAVTNDANNLYVASSSTTWKLVVGGAGISPATTVTNATGFGLAPVVGAGPNYATEQHSHGSVGHDSHALLSGVSADQHHPDVHGSAKHTGGVVALSDEASLLGLIDAVTFAGSGVLASIAGTTGTITISGAAAALDGPCVEVCSADATTAVKAAVTARGGFVCDASSDEDEINLAINRAAAIAGRTSPGTAAPTVTGAQQMGRVQLWAGRYQVNGPILIRSGVTLAGTGRLTEIRVQSGAFAAAGAGTDTAVIKKFDVDQHLTTVRDLFLHGASATGLSCKYGIYYEGAAGDYSAYPSAGSGDAVDTVRDVWIEAFTGAARGGIYFKSDGGEQKAWLIDGVHVHNIQGNGIEVDQAADGEIIGAESGGCTGDGFLIASPNVRMAACKSWYCDAYGFEFISGRLTLAALEAQDCANGYNFAAADIMGSSIFAETCQTDGILISSGGVQLGQLKVMSRGASGRYATQANGLRFAASYTDLNLSGQVDTANITNKIAGTLPTLANRNHVIISTDAGTGTGTGAAGLGTGSLTIGWGG